MQRLETHRLKLLPYTLALKKVTLSERARLTQMLGVAIPDVWPEVDLLEALPLFIEAMEKDPLGLVWDGIILHKADQVAIGGIGFHGPPDVAGRVEIGYNIIPAYEGQGYATELARRARGGASQKTRSQPITAEGRADKIGSQRVTQHARRS